MIKLQTAKNRSLEENAYYHGIVVRSIADYKDWSVQRAHEWIKQTFGIDSTANLTTTQFEELMENVRNYTKKYWELEISLPKKL